ncbi:methyltransferase [Methanobrevibacter sp. 87.7]|uniref:HemK2/MTQ2 family protein methyltransferase n=1 Tax=Methanobrevibacter sp. 87.7 TaxID=387957 RepID=UPI000B513A98|nr:HemK2/MTQ2 family protein methyltransferase [Methanobrevibacter sp. 87.7]OWT32950.1 methyltransferase [Methanobrevibacter sp. 87.7]
MGKYNIKTDDLVYEPAEDTFLLAENLQINPEDSVLEIGTGSGLVAIYAREKSDKITVSDININALEIAEENFKNNGINDIEIKFGNLYEPFENRKFDVILFNTPYLPTEKEDIIDTDLNYAFDGGVDGRKVIDPFLYGLKNHLNKHGKVQMIQSSLSNIEKTFEILESEGFICEITKKEHFFFEDVVLITATLI